MARPPPRRRAAAAPRAGRDVRRVRDAARRARRPAAARPRRGARLPRRGARARAVDPRPPRRRRRPRDGAPARAPAHRDDAAGDPARPARHRARARRPPPAARGARRPDGPRRDRDPGRAVRDGRRRRPLRVRQRAPAPRGRRCRASASAAPRSPTRPSCTSPRAAATSAASGGPTRAGRGRRTTTSPTQHGWAAGPDGWRQWRVDGWSPLHPEEPVVHVSWFEADALARAHDARLPTEAEWEKAAAWDQATRLRDDPQPRPDRARSPPGRRRTRRGPARDARRHLGVDRDGVRRLPRLPPPPLPRVLRGLLPQGLPRAARRLVGDALARGDDDVPQLGPPPAAPDLLRRDGWPGTHDEPRRRAAARSPTTCSTA